MEEFDALPDSFFSLVSGVQQGELQEIEARCLEERRARQELRVLQGIPGGTLDDLLAEPAEVVEAVGAEDIEAEEDKRREEVALSKVGKFPPPPTSKDKR